MVGDSTAVGAGVVAVGVSAGFFVAEGDAVKALVVLLEGRPNAKM